MPSAATMFQQAMSKAGRESMGLYVPNTYLTIGSSTTFTVPQWIIKGIANTNTLLGWGVWRPGSATAADWFRRIVSFVPSTGVFTIDIAWSDTTVTSEDFYILPPGITPNLFTDSAQNSLKKQYFWNEEPFSMKPVDTGIADAGMQNVATSAYQTYGTTTFTKSATANSERVYPGRINSGKIANSAVNSGVYQTFTMPGGSQAIVHNLSMLDSGTSSALELYDGSNVLGTTLTHSHRAWQYMRRTETLTSSKKTLTVRQLGSGSSDTVYLNGLHVVYAGMRYLVLDTRWDTAEKIPNLAFITMGTSRESNVFDAFSTQVEAIPPGEDTYMFDFQRPGANPSGIRLFDGFEKYLQHPIIIQGRRALSDLYSVSLTDITTSIPAEIDMWDAMFRLEFYQQGEVQKAVPDWNFQLSRAWSEFTASTRKQQTVTPSKKGEMGNWTPVRN